MTDINALRRALAEDWLTNSEMRAFLREAADEVERLTEALQEIAEDPYAVDGGAAEIARRALEPKP